MPDGPPIDETLPPEEAATEWIVPDDTLVGATAVAPPLVEQPLVEPPLVEEPPPFVEPPPDPEGLDRALAIGLVVFLLLVLAGILAAVLLTRRDHHHAAAPARSTTQQRAASTPVASVPNGRTTSTTHAKAPVHKPATGQKTTPGKTVPTHVVKSPPPVVKSPPPPPPVKIPDLVGESRSQAQRALRARGLSPRVHPVPSQQDAGTVIAQYPKPGKSVARGTAVRINVARAVASTGPTSTEPPPGTTPTTTNTTTTTSSATVSVPDVTGLDEQDATSQLQDAGFDVATNDEPTSDQSQDGTVLDQTPEGGGRAPSGSTVTIGVGRFSG